MKEGKQEGRGKGERKAEKGYTRPKMFRAGLLFRREKHTRAAQTESLPLVMEKTLDGKARSAQ